MANPLFLSSDSLTPLGADGPRRLKPEPDVRIWRGLCVLPPGMKPFSSENLRRLWLRYNVWLLLTLLALGGGVQAFLNEYSVSWLVKVHQMTINSSKFSHGIQFLLWTLWTLGCVVLSCICVALSDSHAAEGAFPVSAILFNRLALCFLLLGLFCIVLMFVNTIPSTFDCQT